MKTINVSLFGLSIFDWISGEAAYLTLFMNREKHANWPNT